MIFNHYFKCILYGKLRNKTSKMFQIFSLKCYAPLTLFDVKYTLIYRGFDNTQYILTKAKMYGHETYDLCFLNRKILKTYFIEMSTLLCVYT